MRKSRPRRRKQSQKKPVKPDCLFYFDGGSRGNPGLAACACILDDRGRITEKTRVFKWLTNNEAEYQGALLCLETAQSMRLSKFTLRSDSQLVVCQLLGLWKVKNQRLTELHAQASKLIKTFESVDLQWIPRKENEKADFLCNKAMNDEQGIETDYSTPAEKLAKKIQGMNSGFRSFHEYFDLKSGRDKWSATKIDIIKEATLPEARAILDAAPMTDEYIARAYRWHARGLDPVIALRKAMVDREMAAVKINAPYEKFGFTDEALESGEAAKFFDEFRDALDRKSPPPPSMYM